MRFLRRIAAPLALALGTLPTIGWSQVVETPVPFDSAGRVHSITPALVARYQLSPPEWPVAGDFLEARLFAVSTGGAVLAVQRPNGAVERHALTDAQAEALRDAIDAAFARSGAAATDARSESASESVGGAFVRNQMLLTWGVYGPSLAAATNDGKVGTSLYLLATGASYFITTGLSKRTSITRAQNLLATDGAFRGWLTGAGLLYAVAGDDADSRSFALAGLVGSLAGTTFGYNFGRRLTDSEAEAATTISTLSAATALGLAGTFGLINEAGDDRESVGIAVAGGVAGYMTGFRYPRTQRYVVTRGDIQLLNLGAVLGVATAMTFVIEGEPDAQTFFAVATAGMLGGTALVERRWIRRFDHTTSEAGQIALGAAAGGLMGAAGVVLFEPNATGGMAMVTGGAILGAVAGHALASPRRENRSTAPGSSSRETGAASRSRRATLTFAPGNLAFAAAGVPGDHAVVRVRF